MAFFQITGVLHQTGLFIRQEVWQKSYSVQHNLKSAPKSCSGIFSCEQSSKSSLTTKPLRESALTQQPVSINEIY